MSDIQLPEDNKRSRLPKPEQAVKDEEFITAAQRFTAFRAQHPNGWHDTAIEKVVEHPDGHITYIVRAQVWTERPAIASVARPDATAWAQGSTKDQNQIIAGSPLESADTLARSRALRNLGILPTPGDTTKVATLGEPQTDQQIGAGVAAARERAELSQTALADLVTSSGVNWSQNTVHKVEKGQRPLRFNEAQHLAQLIGFGS